MKLLIKTLIKEEIDKKIENKLLTILDKTPNKINKKNSELDKFISDAKNYFNLDIADAFNIFFRSKYITIVPITSFEQSASLGIKIWAISNPNYKHYFERYSPIYFVYRGLKNNKSLIACISTRSNEIVSSKDKGYHFEKIIINNNTAHFEKYNSYKSVN